MSTFSALGATERRAIDIFRIANDKIVEHWGHGDNPAECLREPKRP